MLQHIVQSWPLSADPIQCITIGSCNIRCLFWLLHHVPKHPLRKTPQREYCGSNVESSLRKISRNQGLRLPTHGSPKVAVSTSCVECLRVAGSVPTFSGILVADLIHELKMQFPNATIIHNGGVGWARGILYVDDLRLISTDAGGKNSRWW